MYAIFKRDEKIEREREKKNTFNDNRTQAEWFAINVCLQREYISIGCEFTITYVSVETIYLKMKSTKSNGEKIGLKCI